MNILKLGKKVITEKLSQGAKDRGFLTLCSQWTDRETDFIKKTSDLLLQIKKRKEMRKLTLASYTLPSPLLQKYNLFCVLACKTRQFCKIWIVIFSEGAKNICLAFVFSPTGQNIYFQ